MNDNAPQVQLCERCRLRQVEGDYLFGYLCNRCSNIVAQEAIDKAEAEGILKKTGEFRPDSNGKMQPLYTLTELGLAARAGSRYRN